MKTASCLDENVEKKNGTFSDSSYTLFNWAWLEHMRNYLNGCLFTFSLSTRNSKTFILHYLWITSGCLQIWTSQFRWLRYGCVTAIQSSIVTRFGFGVLNTLLQIEIKIAIEYDIPFFFKSTQECKCLHINFGSLSSIAGTFSTFQTGSKRITIGKTDWLKMD